MKNMSRFIFVVAAIVAFASCVKDINNPVDEKGPEQENVVNSYPSNFTDVTFSTSPNDDVQLRTTYDNRAVYWEETDEISVFSVGSENVNSKGVVSHISEDKTKVQFTAMADPTADSYYAVYPYSEANACGEDGTLTVNILSEQTAVVTGFMSGANTSVAYSEPGSKNLLQFKNVAALLCISFETDADAAATKSVTIKAKKNETEFWGLTGKGKVSFDADNNLVIEEGDVEYVTLNAPQGGFVKSKAYHIPVYAVGDVAGFEVTYLDTEDLQYVKTNNLPAELKRNVLFNIGSIPNPYAPQLPAEFEVVIDFSEGWPFVETCKPLADQTEDTLDDYTLNYEYEFNGKTYTEVLTFGLFWGQYSGDKGYEYTSDGLLHFISNNGVDANNGGSHLKLPVIKGRYLKALKFIHTTGRSRRFIFTRDVYSFANYKQISGNTSVNSGTEYTYYLPRVYDNVTYESELGMPYAIRARDGGIKIQKVTAVYSKTKPE